MTLLISSLKIEHFAIYVNDVEGYGSERSVLSLYKTRIGMVCVLDHTKPPPSIEELWEMQMMRDTFSC